MKGVIFVLRLKLENPLNGHSFGFNRKAMLGRAGARRKQRGDAKMMVRHEMARAKLTPQDLVPCAITFRRMSSGKGLDVWDSLPASCKSVLDGVCDALGIDDGGPFLTVKYENKRCARGCFGLEVQIERRRSPRP